MEKYSTQHTKDIPNSTLADIYRDVAFKRQMTATRVDSVRDAKKLDDAPSWRGDHTFSSDAAKYSFLNFIEPDVAQKHPEWTKQKVRKEALVKFQQRLEQDLAYEQKESTHQETAVQWKVIQTDTGKHELATDYGGETITLRQLWDHTREYAEFVGIPAAYNREEEKAQYAMEQAFVRGDVGAYVSVLSHPDAVRYVQVWERGEDGVISSKQIDLYKTTGRDFTQSEGDALVKHLAVYSKEAKGADIQIADVEYAHFMIETGVLQENDIRTIAAMQAHISHVETSVTPALHIAIDDITTATRTALIDTRDGMRDVRAYVEEVINEKIVHLKKFISPESTTPKVTPIKDMILEPDERSVESVQTGEGSDKASQEKTAPAEHSFVEHSPIKDALSEWVITQTVIQVASIYPESAGGALFWILQIGENAKKSEVKEKNTTVSSVFVENVRKIMRSVIKIFESNDQPKTLIKTEPEVIQEKIIEPAYTEIPQLEPARWDAGKEFVRLLFVDNKSPSIDDVSVLMQKISEILFRESHKRSVVLSDVSLSERTVKSDIITVPEPGRSVGSVIFAMLYWVLLSYNRDTRSVSTVSPQATAEKLIDGKNISKEKKKRIITPPWILLAIIWHLTMLREGAMVTASQQVVAVQSAQITDSTGAPQSTVSVLPLTGVIFPSLFVLE